MKTIRELKDDGLISTHLYRILLRGVGFDNKYKLVVKHVCADGGNANDLTVKDIFELWTEKEILKWRGMGQSTFSELKGLI